MLRRASAEVLIEEVLKEMKGLGQEVKLQDVFDNSMLLGSEKQWKSNSTVTSPLWNTSLKLWQEDPEQAAYCVHSKKTKLFFDLFDTDPPSFA